MLCQFTFKNFKSYRDETTLDFQAAPIKEFSDSLLKTEGASGAFLPVAAIYGPNGGGKSGVLEALRSLVQTVLSPVSLFVMKSGATFDHLRVAASRPFKFNQASKEQPTVFEVFFRTHRHECRYGLSAKGGAIIEESLYARLLSGTKPAMIFERTDDEVLIGASLCRQGIPKRLSINDRMPLLSFLAINYDSNIINEVMDWFKSCGFVNCVQNTLPLRMQISWDIMEDERLGIEKLLSHMDLGIQGYRLEREELDSDNRIQYAFQNLFLQHDVGGVEYELALDEESAGTQRLLELFPSILISLQKGTLLVVDELDDRLHPKLLRQIISFYKDPRINVGGGQLLFTSHDVCTMRNSVFRRDEIWFAAKDETESSMLYSLYEIRDEDGGAVKATAAYDKQYLEGRYGADPYFERMRGWSDHVE